MNNEKKKLTGLKRKTIEKYYTSNETVKKNNFMINMSEADFINARINAEICQKTIELVSDNNLFEKYILTPSVKKNHDKLQLILQKENISIEKQNNILKEYLMELIPPGTKGVVRGYEFNQIVRNFLLSLKLPKKRFELEFEKHHISIKTEEKPDWYIYDRQEDKIIIGMNQLDLWKGGHQLNRGSKYLIDNKNNTKKSKLLCVVCNYVIVKNQRSKLFNFFKVGFENNTLCYLKGLRTIINNYFDL